MKNFAVHSIRRPGARECFVKSFDCQPGSEFLGSIRVVGDELPNDSNRLEICNVFRLAEWFIPCACLRRHLSRVLIPRQSLGSMRLSLAQSSPALP